MDPWWVSLCVHLFSNGLSMKQLACHNVEGHLLIVVILIFLCHSLHCCELLINVSINIKLPPPFVQPPPRYFARMSAMTLSTINPLADVQEWPRRTIIISLLHYQIIHQIVVSEHGDGRLPSLRLYHWFVWDKPCLPPLPNTWMRTHLKPLSSHQWLSL